MKKLFKVLLAVVMIFSFSKAVTVKAEADLTGHTYTAYQIFKGTQAEGEPELGDIDWGTGINASAFVTALKGSTAFGDPNPFASINYSATDSKASAVAVAEIIKNWADGSANAKAFAKLAENNTVNTAGIALSAETVLDAGYYLIVDTTTGDVPVYNLALLQLTQKGTFDIASKVSLPTIDKTFADGTKANNKAIGDVVEYKIVANIPADVTDYNFYNFVIRDTLSEGLTLDATSIAVAFVDGETTTNAVAGDYSAKTGTDAYPYSFQVALTDAKAHHGQQVVITYKATVNADAVIGDVGNPNTVDLVYSNKPDHEYSGSAYPGSNDPVAETPEAYTVTYVTEIKVIKVDEKGRPLTGAGFTLYKGETKVAGETLVNEQGIVVFTGLDAGTYRLSETTIPQGYNPLADITFTISWTAPTGTVNPDSECTWSVNAGTGVTYIASTGTFEVTVVNQKGSTLPETGGIGTKIFYITGSLLVAGAAVFMITKKRTEE